MAQHDFNIANQIGSAFRADLNNALSAIATTSSGSSEPSTTFAHQLWVDTGNNLLKIRNAANNAWITIGVSITASNTFTGDITGNITGNVTGNVTGNITGNVTGDLTGNADTATTLATARTIQLSGDVTGSTSFDGSGNVNITTTISSDSTVLGTDTTGDYVESISGGTGVTITGGTGESSTPTVAIGQAVGTTDNVSFGVVTASLTGNVTGNVTGDITGDLTGDVTGTVSSIANHSTSNLSEGTNLYYTDTRFDTRLATKDTDNLTEGSSNLYFTNERVDDRVNSLLTAGANISLTYDDSANTLTIAATEDNLSNNDTDDLSEGSSNLYFTNARARSAISAGGDLSYNSTSGVMSFTKRTDAEVRGLVSASGDLSYNSSTGAFSFTERTDAEVRGLLSASGDLSYNSSTGAFSFTQRTDAQVRGLLSASGDLSYNSSTGAFSFTERTDAEVRGLISGSTGVSYNSSTGAISIGQAVGTTNDVTFNDVTVSGDLTVSGTTTTVNTETINLADNQIVLNSNFTGSSPTENGGIEIERGTQTNKTLVWNETDDKWTVGSETFVAATFEGALTGNVTGNLTGNVTGNVTGDVTGNADTATTLATARTINGTSFDGSANISFDTDSVSEGSSNLYYTNARSRAAISASGDLSYNSSTGVISFTASAAPVSSVNTQTGAVVLDSDDIAEGSSNLYHTQERVEDIVGGMVTGNTETGITVTYQDADGTLDFEVGTLNQDTTGNAATATALQTARTIGGVSFDGTSNIDLAGVNTAGNQNTTGNAATATALETARTIHGVSFDGSANIDLSEEVQDTVGAMFTGNTETGITATYQDADGTIDLVVGTLNQDTTGNAATATALETARNFSISGDITASNVSFDGTGNVALSADIDANTVGITELNVSDGTNGQALVTDGSGNLSFSTVAVDQTLTVIGRSANVDINITSGTLVVEGRAGNVNVGV